MAHAPYPDEKLAALRRARAVNPQPQAVRDPLFAHSDFFDPRDLVQVRYEMVRRVQIEGQRITAVVQVFGVARSTFYQAQAALRRAGLPGLLPHRRGPQQPHKLRAEVMAFIAQTHAADVQLSAAELAQRVHARFGVAVHPRSIQRGLQRRAKRGRISLL